MEVSAGSALLPSRTSPAGTHAKRWVLPGMRCAAMPRPSLGRLHTVSLSQETREARTSSTPKSTNLMEVLIEAATLKQIQGQRDAIDAAGDLFRT
eukprot:3622589-Pyramimonas_sp.AAC.1